MRLRKQRAVSKDVKVSSLKRDVSRSIVARARVKFFVVLGACKRFYREYKLPSAASALFISMVLVFAAARLLERTSLISLRSSTSGDEGGYSILLSGDQTDEFTRQNTDEDDYEADTTNNTTQSVSNSFTITNVDEDTPTTTIGGGGTSSGGGSSGGGSDPGDSNDPVGETDPGGGGSTDPDPTPPFTASIDSFGQASVVLKCNNPSKPSKGTCSKVYSYSAGIETENGPGTVSYSWQSNLGAGSGSGSYTASAGNVLTSVNKELTLACNKSTSFSIQLVVLSPTFANSTTLNANHNCSEI